MTRQEKIKLLNDIAAGLLPSDTLHYKPFVLCLDYGNRVDYKADGEPITKDEWLRLGGDKGKNVTIKIKYESPYTKATLIRRQDENEIDI